MSGQPGRLLVRRLGGEGVALDLDTGAYYRLAGAAVAIAEALAGGEAPAAVAARLAEEARIDPARARADVDAVAAAFAADTPGTRRDPSFAPAGGGLALSWGGREVLHLDGSGRSASLSGDPAVPPSPAERLRWALPHMIWLAGGAVFHAGATRLGGAVLALTGASGSGKSTLARLLGGGAPVSDDLLFLRPGPGGPEAVLGGEPAARAWQAREGARLAA
ncbi:MAG TPA: PqqD family peptide modification chaperone, partial [Anaeromyxobacteraceae bacterium]|nr:PqqD family peptide modification chaperone [Anaeromyxobacteraceae bacterium]